MDYQGTLKSYTLGLYDLEDGDGLVIEMPEGAIYRSMEGKVKKTFDGYSCGGSTYEYGLLWMEIDESRPLIKRRFKGTSNGMKIESYMDFLGVFTVLIDFDFTKTFHVYELSMDPNDVEMKWEKTKDNTHWKLKHYRLYAHGQSHFGDPPLWNLVLAHKNIDSEYWELIDYCKSKTIPMKILRYIKKNYKTPNAVKELIESQDLDLTQFK